MEKKFCKISKAGFVNYRIRGTILEVSVFDKKSKPGEKCLKIVLKNGTSKIVALSSKNTFPSLENLFKVGQKVLFESGTFTATKRNKNFPSSSTSKFDLTFIKSIGIIFQNATPLRNRTANTGALSRVVEDHNFDNISFSEGDVYRYFGCHNCTRKIEKAHNNGQYFCKGVCKQQKNSKSRNGVVTERKICLVIRNIILVKTDGTEFKEQIVMFDRHCQTVLGFKAEEFQTDEDVLAMWNIKKKSKYCVKIDKTKKTRGSSFPTSYFVSEIQLVQTTDAQENGFSTDAQPTENEPVIEFTGKKKKSVKLNIPKFEIKLRNVDDPTLQSRRKELEERYDLSSTPPGLVLLINNHHFPFSQDEKYKSRIGSRMDMDRITEAFQGQLKYELFEGKCHLNIENTQKFSELLSSFKDALKAKEYSCLIFIISSHGTNLQIELTGEDPKSNNLNFVDDILLEFSEEKFPEFQGKPKLFFPAACQNFGTLSTSNVKSDLSFIGNKLFDMFVCFPCMPGYAAYRNHTDGSVFINYFIKNLMEFGRSLDVKSIMDLVSKDIKGAILKSGEEQITLPYYLSSIFKRFHFLPHSSPTETKDVESMDVE